MIEVIGLPDKITKLTFGESTAWLIDYKWIFLTLFIILFLSIMLGGIVYLFFLLYPAFKAGERKGDIDRNLPYAVTFLYALSNGGMNIVEMFRSLAECKDTIHIQQEHNIMDTPTLLGFAGTALAGYFAMTLSKNPVISAIYSIRDIR